MYVSVDCQAFRFVMYMILLLIQTLQSYSLANSKTQTAFIGSNVTLECTTWEEQADEPVFWFMKKEGEDSKMMSINGKLGDAYDRKKYSIVRHDSHFYLFISNVTPNDDAEYKCYRVFKENEADVTKLIVYALPSPLIVKGWEKPVSMGNEVKLECESPGGRPRTMLRWTKAADPYRDLGGLVLNTKHTDGTFISRKVLTFIVSRKTMKDVYRCSGDIIKLGYNETKDVKLDVNVPPLPPIIDGELGGDEGTTVTVHCHSNSAKPQPTIIWTSEQQTIDDEEMHITNPDKTFNVTSFIHLKLHRIMDGKEYVCSTTNLVLESQNKGSLQTTFKVKVNYSPTIKVKEEYTVDQGNRVTLKCEVSAKPGARPAWFRNTKPIKSKPNKYEVVLSNEFNYLTITNVQKEDSGNYTCFANNTLGKVRTNTSLVVRHRPVITIGPASNVGVLEHHDVTLQCKIDAIPNTLHFIKWYHNNEEIDVNLRKRFSGGEKTLTIRNTKRSDSGTYTCKAKNELGESTSGGLQLQIEYDPENIHISSSSINITESQRVPTASCSAHALPSATYTWYRNGRQFSNGANLTFTTLASSETKGNYTCTASNKWGTQTAWVNINVFYSPICQDHQKLKYGVAFGKQTMITCYIKANPNDAIFTWKLMNRTLVSNNTDIHRDGLNAFHAITYTPRTPSEYGTISCSARNTIGIMKKPCDIDIVPSGPPEPPQNCSFSHITYNGLTLRCDEGFDGGSAQTFLLQRRDFNHYLTQANQSTAHFFINSFEPSTPYKLRVCAINQEFSHMVACTKLLYVTTKKKKVPTATLR